MFEPQKCNILIVDDNPKNLQVLGSTLLDIGYKIEVAMDGTEALEWLKDKAFDMVLLDVMMPGMDGFEVCTKIRENEKLDNLPVLFLTAKTDKESLVAGFKMGAQDYITKPFDKDELLARVKTHLELKQSKELILETNKWLEEKVAERTRELSEANAELRVLDDAKTDFLNIISHEIRTPLNGIMGFLNLLKGRVESEELKTFINMLDLSATRLEKFATTALHITNLKVKSNQIFLKELPVSKLIEDSIGKVKEHADKKGIEITYKAAGEEMINGDPNLLGICFVSLLDNSINHSAAGDRIQITTEAKDGLLICEINDEGSGFSEDALNNLYKMFSPGEAHIDSNKGLSLSLVKHIMDAHEGKIELWNNEKRGATVKLSFKK